ncbi:MAG: molybdopterin molybdotransferase MoeA [Roseinatronobacter sp.]
MISVEEALSQIIALVRPLPTEMVSLSNASGRVLREAVSASHDQPPFTAAAMDGYAVTDPVTKGAKLRVIGQAAAGHAFDGQLQAGEAIRIFTGAPVPAGATRIVIQEDVQVDAEHILLKEPPQPARHIREKGIDFSLGDQVSAPRRLRPVDLALLAAMNCPEISASRMPDVAIIATGDELVMPGETPRANQIIASNAFTVKALAEMEGASARILPIARDTEASLRSVFDLAQDADLVVTIGGASVGDHDLVSKVALAQKASLAFHKVAIRPGKPLMAGRLGHALLLGLPGNPVSSIICAHLFMRPALRAMQGLGGFPLPSATATLAADLPANGNRAHYMRATLGPGPIITALDDQDSSLLTVLCAADALLVRPANDPAREAGEQMRYIAL